VANLISDDVSAYTVNRTTGALTQIDCGAGPGCNGANFAAGTNPRSVAATPSGKFLYVANSGSGDVSAYTIAATGALTPIDCGGGTGCNGAKFTAGGSPTSLIVDSTGNFVYVANRGAIVAFAIHASTGVLLRLGCGGGAGCSGSDFAAGVDPFAIAADPLGRYVYVANLSGGDLGGNVSAFRMNPVTGALSKTACVGAAGVCSGSNYVSGVAPFAIAVDPTGSFVHAVTQPSTTTGTFSSVAAFTINAADGALLRANCTNLGFGPACSANIPENFTVGGNPSAVGTAPSGKFVYAATTTGVSAYSLNPDSTLDRIDCGGGPGCNALDFGTGVNGVGIAFDTAGGYAYVLNLISDGVAVFTINATTGVLTRVDCGAGPGCNGTDFAGGSGARGVAIISR
jgi:DNA-binding beta-propeller fold protein YncE